MWQSVIALAHGGERTRIVPLSSWRARMKGLLGRSRLHRDVGVLLHPCNAVHTVGMRFALDVIFLDREFKVLRVVPGLRPGRLVFCLGACCVVECATRPDESIATLSRRAAGMGRRACELTYARRRARELAQVLARGGSPAM